jgi:hypothetical protein
MTKSGKNTFLLDRYDEVRHDPTYVGTHRRERSSWSLFAPIGIGLGAVVVLVLAGLWFVDRSDDYLQIDALDVPVIAGEAPDEAPVVVEPETPAEVEPVRDPTQIDTEGLTLTVLNGTDTTGLAAQAGERLVAAGWPEPTATNADSSDIAESVVAYQDDADRGIALGIAEILGVAADQVVQTTAYPGARVTVLLGGDYASTQAT